MAQKLAMGRVEMAETVKGWGNLRILAARDGSGS